jgi:hypothetical protein
LTRDVSLRVSLYFKNSDSKSIQYLVKLK